MGQEFLLVLLDMFHVLRSDCHRCNSCHFQLSLEPWSHFISSTPHMIGELLNLWELNFVGST